MAGRTLETDRGLPDEDPRFSALLDEALSGADAAREMPADLADRIVAQTQSKLPRFALEHAVAGRVGGAGWVALRWSMALAASVFLALSASYWMAVFSDTVEPSPRLLAGATDQTIEGLEADALDRALESLEADIDSLMTSSAWETTYSALEEELAGWEFHVDGEARMDQF